VIKIRNWNDFQKIFDEVETKKAQIRQEARENHTA
jgi:hypothetical protein